MKHIKKLTALTLVTVTLLCCLASCDLFGGNLQTDKYVANVRIVFATEDEGMRAAIDAMSASSVLTVDGDNVMVDTQTATTGVMVNDSYVYIDGVIYHSTDVLVNSESASSYEKANMPAASRDDLINKIGVGANIGPADFEISESFTSGDLNTYTCTVINDESKASLQAIFAARFAGLDAVVQLDDAEYTLETYKGRNKSSVLSCHFTILLNGESYNITMHTYYDYDYDAKVNISAPQDTDKYTEVSYEKIIG